MAGRGPIKHLILGLPLAPAGAHQIELTKPRHLRSARAMRRALVATACALLLARPATAATIAFDQGFDPGTTVNFGGGVGGDDYEVAQTFTVGLTGTLARLDLFINATVIAGDLFVKLLPTVGGVPVQSTALNLLSVTIPYGAVPIDPPNPTAFYSLDLSAFGFVVTAGDVLAIMLSGTGNYGFGGQNNDPYAAGQFYERRTSQTLAWSVPTVAPLADLAFRTYVDVEPEPIPEPVSLFLVAAGLTTWMLTRPGAKR